MARADQETWDGDGDGGVCLHVLKIGKLCTNFLNPEVFRDSRYSVTSWQTVPTGLNAMRSHTWAVGRTP